jgi:hypothetical protein
MFSCATVCRKIPEKLPYIRRYYHQELSDYAEILSGYAVEIRYPGDFRECSIGEAEEAVEMAKAFKNFVLQKLEN